MLHPGWIPSLALRASLLEKRLSFLLKPRGLDGAREYRVTFDNARETKAIAGSRLADEGLSIELAADPCSELILFES